MKRTAILLAVCLGPLAPATIAAAADPPAVLEIREVYKACQAARRAKATNKIKLFGVYRNLTTQDKAIWRRTPPGQGEGQVLEQATVYKAAGGIRAAELLEVTPSGDWSKLTQFCFRPDGTTAFIFSELRTFYGRVRVEDRLYYDPSGRRIRKIRRVFDLDSKKRIDARKRSFNDRKTPVYLTAKALAAVFGAALR